MHLCPRPVIVAILALLAAAALGACASTDYLPVRYQLPPASASLAGHQVALEVVDQRSPADIFGPTMRQTFRHFTGNFALRVAEGDERGVLLGPVDLTGLFRRALTKRLERSGTQVVDTASMPVPRMRVIINRFKLDHNSTKWTAQIDYRVELTGPGPRRATQNISATEERLRLPGSRDAERVISDVFTVTINRLDLVKLFADAGA
ncbi:MAG: hypothetical protein JRJ72_08735 [Deltaproteobacteria bacterium]|nr:hypothetical protein [Deltaproteobacteria bacterium]RLB97068.1 MAG: hypothetical protein DRH76_05725 [Deltaproteobacteria bacterium]